MCTLKSGFERMRTLIPIALLCLAFPSTPIVAGAENLQANSDPVLQWEGGWKVGFQTNGNSRMYRAFGLASENGQITGLEDDKAFLRASSDVVSSRDGARSADVTVTASRRFRLERGSALQISRTLRGILITEKHGVSEVPTASVEGNAQILASDGRIIESFEAISERLSDATAKRYYLEKVGGSSPLHLGTLQKSDSFDLGIGVYEVKITLRSRGSTKKQIGLNKVIAKADFFNKTIPIYNLRGQTIGRAGPLGLEVAVSATGAPPTTPITEDGRLGPAFIQGPFVESGGAYGNFEAVVKTGPELCHYYRDNTNYTGNWLPSECFGSDIGSAPTMISGVSLRYGSGGPALQVVAQSRADLVHYFRQALLPFGAWQEGNPPVISSGRDPYSPSLSVGNMLQDDSPKPISYRNFDVVAREVGADKGGLTHYSRNGHPGSVGDPWIIVQEGFAPSAISAPALLRSSFEESGVNVPGGTDFRNLELVVREIENGVSRLCHYYRPSFGQDPDNVGQELTGSWQKSQCFGKDISSASAMIQSSFKEPGARHGNFEVVVRRTINGEGKLCHYWRDNAGSPYRWTGPTACFGENVTSSPALVQSTIKQTGATHGNFEVLAWETRAGESQLCHYWRDNSAPSSGGSPPWYRTTCFAARQAAEPVNNLVAFAATQPSNPYTPGDTKGCPQGQGYTGKFRFEATLRNSSVQALTDLGMEIAELNEKNWLLTTGAQLLGAGDWLAMPLGGGYADGVLGPGETTSTSFTICLKTRKPFRFVVNVTGIPDTNGR